MPRLQLAVLGLTPDFVASTAENVAFRFPLMQGIRAQARRMDLGLRFFDAGLWKGNWVDALGTCQAALLVMNPVGIPPVAFPFLKRLGASWLLPVGESHGLTVIRTDEAGAMDGMVGHLAETGRRHLGFIGYRPAMHTRNRFMAVTQSVASRSRLGMTLVSDLDWMTQVLPRAGEPVSGKGAMSAMDRRIHRFLDHHSHLDGIVCATDHVAKSVHRILLSRGVDVPGDMALTGFDDIEVEVPPWGYNPFTTFRQDLGGLSTAAVRFAVLGAQGRQVESTVELPGRLVVRESTAIREGLRAERWPRRTDFRESATRLLEEHGLDEDPADVLCRYFQLGREYFLRKYQRATGRTFVADLTERRLRQAAHLLRHTDLPIMEILTECGFRSHQVFGRAFQKAYRVSPRDFRRKGHSPVGRVNA